MFILLLTSILLGAVALVLNIILIVQGFRVSAAKGIMALLAPLLLAGALTSGYLVAYRTALAECDPEVDRVRQEGQKEFEKQKNELDDLENLEL